MQSHLEVSPGKYVTIHPGVCKSPVGNEERKRLSIEIHLDGNLGEIRRNLGIN